MESQILDLVAGVNPVPDESVLLTDDLDAVRRLIKERSIMLKPTIEATKTGSTPSAVDGLVDDLSSRRNRRVWRSGLVIGAAAALVVFVAFMGGAFDSAGEVPIADSPDQVVVVGSDPAAVVDEYFVAFNAGDADAVVSLLSTDATLTERFDSVSEFDRESWEQDLEFFIAQGTILSSLSCSEADEQPAEATTFSCDYELLDGPTQAVGALPVPVTTRFAVTSSGKISEIHAWYDPLATGIDYLHVGRPFGRWMAANQPDFAGLAITDEPVGDCCELMSGTEIGVLVVQYAQDWAAYLEANGCTYLDGC